MKGTVAGNVLGRVWGKRRHVFGWTVDEGKSGKSSESCAVARLVGSGESDLGGEVWTLSLGQLCS